MAFINVKTRLIQAKIVYYGPSRGGKTTNLEYIYSRYRDRAKSEMVVIKTEGDRTLFFDFLPFDMGLINGYKTIIQLYTVPGQVKYDATRRIVLRGVDGIVFVADSMVERRDDNIASLENLKINLRKNREDMSKIPIVLQYNKRDLKNKNIPILPISQLQEDLNKELKAPFLESSALEGFNVINTLKKIVVLTMERLARQLS